MIEKLCDIIYSENHKIKNLKKEDEIYRVYLKSQLQFLNKLLGDILK